MTFLKKRINVFPEKSEFIVNHQKIIKLSVFITTFSNRLYLFMSEYFNYTFFQGSHIFKKIEKEQKNKYFIFMKIEKTIIVNDYPVLLQFLGQNDAHLKLLQKELPIKISVRGNEIKLFGKLASDVTNAENIINFLLEMGRTDNGITLKNINYVLQTKKSNFEKKETNFFSSSIKIPKSARQVTARTQTQADYLKAIGNNDVVAAIGPAGTGKTYLAMAYAIENLLSNNVKRIILTRPVVEAGESLGFLPGNLEEKVTPYLRPLYDAIFDFIDFEKFEKLVAKSSIEIAPLAYMRGRTLQDAFVILDEAQNTTSKQMQMFLTRLGDNSKMVITGDISQIDLPRSTTSGLVEISKILKDVHGIQFVYFKKEDVVRHSLVQKIIEAYEKFNKDTM